MIELDAFWGAKVFGDFVTQYCELRNEAICIGKPPVAAFRAASKISSQLALEASVAANLCQKFLNDFPDPEKCLKRSKTDTSKTAVPNWMFSGVRKFLAIL